MSDTRTPDWKNVDYGFDATEGFVAIDHVRLIAAYSPHGSPITESAHRDPERTARVLLSSTGECDYRRYAYFAGLSLASA